MCLNAIPPPASAVLYAVLSSMHNPSVVKCASEDKAVVLVASIFKTLIGEVVPMPIRLLELSTLSVEVSTVRSPPIVVAPVRVVAPVTPRVPPTVAFV